MKTKLKFINYILLVTMSLTFSNCTAWPAIAALLGIGGSSSSGPPLIIPPGSSGSSGAGETSPTATEPSTNPPATTPTTTPTPSTPSSIVVSTATASGAYPATTVIDINVKFTEAVSVTGTPRLRLNNTVDVNYLSGTGTDTLLFRYTVTSGNGEDIVGLDTASQTSLSLNGGTIQSVATNTDMALTLPVPGAANSMGNGKVIVIDTGAPTITSVTSSSTDAVYGLGANITVQIVFSEVVNVVGGPPQITLETGTTDRTINCSTGTGTNTLNCVYTVQTGDTSGDLDYVATNSFSLNGATIKDIALNNSNLTLATPGAANSLGANKAIVINTNSPSVTNVTSTIGNGAYTIGQIIPIQVTFSQAVNVTGTPQLTLETGVTDAVLNYASGSGTNTLTFNYTVAVGHASLDLDYGATNSLALNGGTIKDTGNTNDAILTLATPGAANSLGANKAIFIDTVAPAVDSVSSSTADGSYKAGQVISIQVNFSEAVNVTGTPQLTLDTGAVLNYTSGTGTSTLNFSYTIGAGQTSADLDYQSTNALSLNGGSITDASGNASGLTLATPGTANSLGANKAIVVDTTTPTVTSVNSSTVNGSYKAGQSISIQVNFSEAVNVTGTPQLTLETGATDAVVSYSSGSGTSTLNFTYTIGANQTSADLDYQSTAALSLAGGSINDIAGNASTLTLAAPGVANSLGANKAIIVDTTSPTVQNVDSSTTDGAYRAGQAVSIQVNFSEIVTVTGTPQLTLETGTTDAVVNYASGTGTNSLTFTYTIGAGHTSGDLDYQSTTALALNGGTINDAAGNASTLTLVAPGATNSLGLNKNIIIDTTGPTVSSVNSSTANATYKTGQTVSIQVNFNEAVTVTGTPQLTLETGTTDAIINYASGSGTNSLTFTYTIAAGNTSADLDYQSTTALALNGGTLKDAVGNDATLTLAAPAAAGSLGQTKDIIIDTTGPTVTNVTSSALNGSYKAGQAISIQVTFDENVTVTGTPQLTLETGGTDAVVNYASGTGTNTLTFTYTVGAGHTSADLDYQSTTSLGLNGGTMQDAIGNNATLTLAAPGAGTSLGANKAIVIDTTAPTVASVNSSTDDGTYAVGQTVSIQVNFSENVTVTGTPQLTLETGTTDAIVNYTSGSGTSILNFTYTIAAGHTSADLDYQSTTALALNGGTINDAAGNASVLTLAALGAANSLGNNKAIVIDTTVPTVTGVNSSTADGMYGIGQTVSIQVTFDKAVTVTGTPQLTLETGATDAVVNYVSGTGTNTLTFTYTIASGQTSADLDYQSTTALALNGGTIKDAIGNNATLTLFTPGATNSLASNKAIVINTTTPTVSFSSSTSTNSETTTSVTIPVTLSAISALSVTVDYAVTGGTATGGGTDYTLTSGTLTFSQGETSKNITLTVVNDSLNEADETIIVGISNPTNSTLGGTTSHTYTITNDDPVPTLSINNATVTEGNSGTVNATFTVSLSAESGQVVTVDYITADVTAIAGTDYVAIGTTTLTFTAGQTLKTVTVTVNGDLANEVDETFNVTLSNVSASATIATATGVGTITNDDALPTVAFGSASSSSGDETQVNRTIPVTLSVASGQTVTVIVTDAGGTGTSGVDYMGIGSPLTISFAPGSTSQNVTIGVLQDTIFEPGGETISLTLSSPSNATLGTQTTHIFTITDDEMSVTAAETMDCDNNGRIDHYKITLSAAVNDSTFPGYSVNSLGTTTTDWIITGYSSVALRHGTAVATSCAGETDTVNDTILYLSFAEGGSFDTGAKPDLTTTANPALVSASGSMTVAQISTATISEADRAKPVVVSATGQAGQNKLTVTFSENVWSNTGMPACGSGGEMVSSDLNYVDGNTSGAASLIGMDTDNCAVLDNNAVFTTNVNFVAGDNTTDTVAGRNATNFYYDAANNQGSLTAKPLTISAGGPTITSIEQYDANGNGKIDQLKITFSTNVNDATIDDVDAARFTVGGTAASIVDSATSGTGTTTNPPNADPSIASDSIVTIFTDDTSAAFTGTSLKAVSFTQNTGRWMGNGTELQTILDLTAVTVDKAPPVILTALASDNANAVTGVDSDDTLVLTFSEGTNKPTIDSSNISSIFSLSSAHAWGNISSAVWNAAGTQLTLTFAGTGAPTVAVGDTITILGTIADTASSPNISVNKPSVSPIIGTFYTDSEAPYLVSAYNITTTTATIRFSEAVLMDGTANAANTIANYAFVEDPANSGCTDLTISSITVVSTDTVQLNLSGILCSIQYKVTVSNVKDYSNNTIGSPNYLTFVGNEQLKVVSIVPLTTSSFRVNFNRPVKAGNDVASSGGCTNATQCGYRYYVAPAELGSINSATVGTGSLANTVTISHSVAQLGKSYTIIVANNANSDGFNNTSWGSIRDVTDSMNVQAAPSDRATFVGLGSSISTIGGGAFFTDPFFDGTSFSFVFKYGGRVYLGTNDKNTAAFRFDPNGNNAVTATFKYAAGSCSTTTGFGYGTSPVCGTNSGPNAERGVVGFTSGIATIGGTNYQMLLAGPIKDNVGFNYYTQDLDTLLDWSQAALGSYTGGANTKSAQTLYVSGAHQYTCMASDHNTQAPICVHSDLSASGGIVSFSNQSDMGIRSVSALGKNAGGSSNPASGVVGIDSILIFNNYLYLANNGGVRYSSDLSGFTSSVSGTPAFTGTTLVLPAAPAGLEKVGNGQRGIPVMTVYNGKVYMVRNVAVGTGATNEVTPLRGEVWKCDPAATGNASICETADWTQIISGTESEFGASAFSISMFQENGTGTVYLGIDNATTGVQVFRVASSNISATTGTPKTLSSAGWAQQGTNGLGTSSPIFTKVYSSTTISDGAYNYIYFTSGTGVGGAAIKVYRQLDAVAVAFFMNESVSELLAYVNNEENPHYPIALTILVLGILGFFWTRRLFKNRGNV